MNQGIVLFHTTTSALRAEKILKRAGLQVKLVPTPRELSSDCSLALRFEPPQCEQVRAGLAGAGVEHEIRIIEG